MTATPFVGPTVQMEIPSRHRHPRPRADVDRGVGGAVLGVIFAFWTVLMPAPPTADQLVEGWALLGSHDSLAAWGVVCRPTVHPLACATVVERLT